MDALAELFDETTLVLPVTPERGRGEIALTGHRLHVAALTPPPGTGLARKLLFPFWVARNFPTIWREVNRADAVHVPIPGDIGTVGMLLAYGLRKPLFVRYCGNWFAQTTAAEHFWKWFMEQCAGGRNVMLATGGSPEPPSPRNPAAQWIFSTTLSADELEQLRTERTSAASRSGRLIIVCRQEGGKGTELLLESVPLVAEKFPDVRLDIVGDGDALPSLQARARELGIANRVLFHGAVDHQTVLTLLREADLFCYPTATEGFPKVVLEAMACGLPVVTTPVSVLPHLINGCGVLLDAMTPRALADAISTCLSEPDAYMAMSRRATERAQGYSLEQWGETIGRLLRAAWGPLQTRA
jgi:hypothetical protein